MIAQVIFLITEEYAELQQERATLQKRALETTRTAPMINSCLLELSVEHKMVFAILQSNALALIRFVQ
jgi:hypothetical protein